MKPIRDCDQVRDTVVLGTIIIPVGLPRSGKSTWSKQTGLPIVSKDALRLAVHGTRYDAWVEPLISGLVPVFVDALFQAGHDTIILDECNVTKEHRDRWRNRGYNIRVKVFDTSASVCKDRAILTGQPDLLPVIDMMEKVLVVEDITDEELIKE